jgi:hypothetical protein
MGTPAAIARWDGFLEQIATRHRSVRADAEASARTFIGSIAGGGDYQPLSNQLMAVRNRLQELETMIIDTWHAKVEDAIFAEGGTVADRDREYWKGETLKRQLDGEREEMEPRIFAALARERFAAALARYAGDGGAGASVPMSEQSGSPARVFGAVGCARCGTRLEVGGVTFRAVELGCHCGARTAFEPGDLMRSVAAIGTHAIAQEAVVAEWRAMRDADQRVRDTRPPVSLAVLKAYEAAQINYWRAYLGVRCQLEPELAQDPAKEIRMRMEQWYQYTAEHEEAWVKAGRPRAV